ncbi:phosphatases II [Amniculicola lignicola CBS 123094]|uniref:protein-tyrosine-phosphatase n=1 Tax=Amniculicola lignicola CBS 123094 TaxID=1392246 RepID=A0A6A5W690_9PLEO|nr:phosphatases II [Amniculicola lignicola CBS 123094]
MEEGRTEIKHLHVDIEDNPMEDLLMCLDGLCNWIASALSANSPEQSTTVLQDNERHKQIINHTDIRINRVLVHCIQGISRSGAIIVACLMRNSSSYDEALDVARQYRSAIAPNSGFAEQLRVWKRLDCSIYTMKTIGGKSHVELKQDYDNWKENRGILLSTREKDTEQKRKVMMMELAVKHLGTSL